MAQVFHPSMNTFARVTIFGAVFVGVRFVFDRTINWLGGYRVAMASLSIETIGLVVLCMASNAHMAVLGAAIAGLGFSLVFPALGVEAVHRVPTHSRGSALGVYSVFMDVAMAITGPLGGLIAVQLALAWPARMRSLSLICTFPNGRSAATSGAPR